MSENTCCSFCEQLPRLARPGRGRISKCPICKQTLWESDCATYRLLDSAASASRKGVWLLSAGAGMILVLCIVATAIVLVPRERRRRESVPGALAFDTLEKPMPMHDRPVVRSKPGAPYVGVSVKPPAPKPVVDVTAAVKPVQLASAPPPPPVKRPVRPAIPAVILPDVSSPQQQLEKLLQDVPQLDLDPEYAKRTKTDLAEAAKKIFDDTKGNQDAFVVSLKKERPDLAGLPFLMGKDCSIAKNEAQKLALTALSVRTLMDKHAFGRRQTTNTQPLSYGSFSESIANDIWADLRREHLDRGAASTSLAALKQMMLVENKIHRLNFIQYLGSVTQPQSSQTLAQIAVFDLDPNVRQIAVATLRDRKKTSEFSPVFVKSLRYPWAPIAQHAAKAIVDLELKELIPDLAAMLDEPSPLAPFVVKKPGEQPKTMVRELVRVNHHRNCMLCHAPVGEATNEVLRTLRDLPIGPVTTADEALPPGSSRLYYSPKKGITVVRADVTYLRQDFSIRQKVEQHGHWPEMQRFDFFVRTTELTENQPAERKSTAGELDFRTAILEALHGLTGQSRGVRSSDWQREAQSQKQLNKQ